MTEAPKRIWAEAAEDGENGGIWWADAKARPTMDGMPLAPYDRADIAADMVAALNQIRDLSESAEHSEMCPTYARLIADKATAAIAKAKPIRPEEGE